MASMEIRERFFLNLKEAMESFEYLLHTSKKLATHFGTFNHFSKPATIDEGDLSKLKLKLEAIQATLKKADALGLSDEFDRLWMRELRDLEYRAEDVVEQIQFEFLRFTRFDEFKLEQVRVNKGKRKNEAGSLFSSFPAGSLDIKIRRIRDRYNEIAHHRDVLRLNPEDGVRRPQPSPLVQSTSSTESKLHGRKADLNKLINLLSSDDSSHESVYSIIPIIGMGGVGKTTLVQHLYRIIENQFDIKIWVCVSQDLDAMQVTRKIAECLGLSACELSQQNLIQEAIIDRLKGKKVLLVLDDVWIEDERHWKSLKVPLKDAAKGSKIIVTTRSIKVSQMMMCTKRLHLGCLSEDDSWSVCFERAQNGRVSNLESDMIDIGRKVAGRCKGLPLVAEAAGAALSLELSEKHWNGVLEKYLLTENKIVSQILPALKVSYDYLPLHLKYCFAYCSLFPKGYVFEKNMLVQLWMAQGFIHPERPSSLEEIGCGYFDDLLERCFFQHSPSHYPSEGKYVMHDLYHELAETVSGIEYDRNEDIKIKKLDEKARHSSMVPQESNSKEAIQLGSFGCQDLRTFLFVGVNKDKPEGVHFSMNIPQDLFSLLECLRALDLSNTDINSLPSTIGQLIHLRYLSVENTKIRVLPESIGGLFNLQTLNLKRCYNLEELPKGMKLLDNLRHLYLPSGGSCCISMPAGMGQMTSLQTLPLIVVKSETDKCGLQELGSLENLKGDLHISEMNNVADADFAEQAKMHNKSKLQKLTLEWSTCPGMIEEPVSEVLEKLKPHFNLEELIIKGFCGNRFPSWLGDKYLSKLATLEIKKCNAEELSYLGRLPSLEYLCIQSMARLRHIGPEFCGHASSSSSNLYIVGFPKLETLVFKKMDAWDKWTGVEKGDFPCLKSLIFNRCKKLQTVPKFPTSDNVKEKNPVIQWLPSPQRSLFSCPLLVLSECGSRFEETAREIQVPSSQVQASRNDPVVVECGSRFEETTCHFQEMQTPSYQAQASSNTPCSDSGDVDMIESGSRLEETKEMQAPDSRVQVSSNYTPSSYSDASIIESGNMLQETAVHFQNMQTPYSHFQASSNTPGSYSDDAYMVESGSRLEESTIQVQKKQATNRQVQMSSKAPWSYSDDIAMAEANAVNSSSIKFVNVPTLGEH